MKRWVFYACLTAAVLTAVVDSIAQAGRARRRGGCCDPCVTYVPAAATQTAQRCTEDCLTGAWTEMQVVLVPTYVTEKRTVCTTAYKDEERQRVVMGYKTVPVTEEKVRFTTVMSPKTETKSIAYTSQLAVQSQEQKSYRIKAPVWEDREESYVVKVPVLTEVEEQYTVKVPILKDVQFEYTVNVPNPVTRTGTRTVSNVVPVVKTKTIDYCVPVARNSNTTVDRGHWETRTADWSAGRGRRGQQTTRRVWVPNPVTEATSTVDNEQQTEQIEYLVYEQHYSEVPYECACIEYRPEVRTGTKQEVVYQDETRTRTRTAVQYRDETRTRMKKELAFKDEERTESYPVVTYQPETLNKEVSYTVYVPETKAERYTVTRQEQVPDHRIESYMVKVAVPSIKEVDVQVTRMVPKVVSVTVNPCNGSTSAAQARRVTVVPASHYSEAATVTKCCGD
jgi:hypothetical protein